MKPIDNTRPIAPQRITPLQPLARSGAAPTEAGNAMPASPEIEASIAAQLSAAGEAPIDTARVGAIRASIKRGDYSLEPGEIADAMIAAGYLKRDTQ